jgi:hypothetical protein
LEENPKDLKAHKRTDAKAFKALSKDKTLKIVETLKREIKSMRFYCFR